MFVYKTKRSPDKFSLRGFTLIELLVVIAIIALLSTTVMASLNTARMKSRDAKRLADIKQLMTALEMAFDANNGYPSIGSDNAGYDIAGLSTALSTFMSPLPKDPLGSTWATYHYVRGPGATSYGILIRLEQISSHTHPITGQCKIGQGINNGWWGGNVPICG